MKTIASKVETPVKLYLEGKPTEVSDATIADLREWLWNVLFEQRRTLLFSRQDYRGNDGCVGFCRSLDGARCDASEMMKIFIPN